MKPTSFSDALKLVISFTFMFCLTNMLVDYYFDNINDFGVLLQKNIPSSFIISLVVVGFMWYSTKRKQETS